MPPTVEHIEEYLRLMVSGRFVADHLGADVVKEVGDRARANATAYLDVFERLFLEPDFDAFAHSDLRIPAFLTFMVDVEPARVRSLAEKLVSRYNAVLVIYDSVADKEALRGVLPMDTLNLSIRLDRQRAALRNLASG
jgi:hypothetical protein